MAWAEEPTELLAHHLHDCSRGIVAAHGGKLVVESRPGTGAVFSFSLPLAGKEDRHE